MFFKHNIFFITGNRRAKVKGESLLNIHFLISMLGITVAMAFALEDVPEICL